MPFEIIRDDIVRVRADAVVNAANTSLECGGGVCGVIFEAAGGQLQEECRRIGGCETGGAVITKGYNLPAKYIIHTPGPVWKGGGSGEEEMLRSCYRSALLLAEKNGLESVAFPLISSGIYGFPKEKALEAAVSGIGSFLKDHDMNVTLVVYDRQSFAISEKLFASVGRYIDDHYAEKKPGRRRTENREFMPQLLTENRAAPDPLQQKSRRSLGDLMEQLDETFSQTLLRLIDEKGRTDAEVYKKANIDRKLFSKIRSDAAYRPSKKTVLALAIALELSLDETKDLLGRAGFALSHSSRFDVIVEYFIGEQNYNIYEINSTLFTFDQDLLGA